MDPVIPQKPQSANDYDDRTTRAVKSVLVVIGQILASFRGKFAVIGGSVPWLLLAKELDVDLSLDAEALQDGQYADLIHEPMGQGYDKTKNTREFQLQRTVPATDGGPAIEILVDFLMPKHADIEKNRPKLIENFRVQRADGADLAVDFHQLVAVSAETPTGGRNTVEIAVCSIPALLAMKGMQWNSARSVKMRMTSTTASGTIQAEPGRWQRIAVNCSSTKAPGPPMSSSTRSSRPLRAMDQPVFVSSWKSRRCSAIRLPSNGNKMRMGRSMSGS